MKNTPFAKTQLKPTKYKHFHLPGRSRGPLQTTKITPGSPPDPPRTPSENRLCFQCLPGPPRGAPGASPGPPQRPPGTPQRRRGPSHKDPQEPPRDLPGPPEGTPESQRTSSKPAREAKGHPRPSQAGPAECAKRLNPPPPARAGSRACSEYTSIRSRSVFSALARSAGRCT